MPNKVKKVTKRTIRYHRERREVSSRPVVQLPDLYKGTEISSQIEKEKKPFLKILKECQNENDLEEHPKYNVIKENKDQLKFFMLGIFGYELKQRAWNYEAVYWYEEYFKRLEQKKDEWRTEDIDDIINLHMQLSNFERVLYYGNKMDERVDKTARYDSRVPWPTFYYALGGSSMRLKDYKLAEYYYGKRWNAYDKWTDEDKKTMEAVLEIYVDIIKVLLKQEKAVDAINEFQLFESKGLNSDFVSDVATKCGFKWILPYFNSGKPLYPVNSDEPIEFSQHHVTEIYRVGQLCFLKSLTYKMLGDHKQYENWLMLARLLFTNMMIHLEKFEESYSQEIIAEHFRINLIACGIDDEEIVSRNKKVFEQDFKDHGSSYLRLWNCFEDHALPIYFQKAINQFEIPLSAVSKFLNFLSPFKYLGKVTFEQKFNYERYRNSLLINRHFQIN